MASKTIDSQKRKVFCAHCQSWLERSTFYRHRRRFFDEKKREWIARDMERPPRTQNNKSLSYHLGNCFDEPERSTGNDERIEREPHNYSDLDIIFSERGTYISTVEDTRSYSDVPSKRSYMKLNIYVLKSTLKNINVYELLGVISIYHSADKSSLISLSALKWWSLPV